MRIGDGCATVTGYELPVRRLFCGASHWLLSRPGRRGQGFETRSQDIGLVVLVMAALWYSGRAPGSHLAANFSVNEKDGASPSRRMRAGVRRMPSFSDLSGLKAFSFYSGGF